MDLVASVVRTRVRSLAVSRGEAWLVDATNLEGRRIRAILTGTQVDCFTSRQKRVAQFDSSDDSDEEPSDQCVLFSFVDVCRPCRRSSLAQLAFGGCAGVIAFFSAKKYDRTFFDQAWALYHNSDAAIQDGAPSLEIRYIENRLEPRTMELAKGIPVICAFVNDHLDANVIGYLAENGLRVIAMRCAGYNNVDINAAHARNVEVVRVPAYSPYAVAEHAVSLFLCLNRKLHKAYNRIRDDNFSLEGGKPLPSRRSLTRTEIIRSVD